MRPVEISEVPPFHPHKCIRCKLGTGGPGREYFVDLGLDISADFNPMYDGNLYYCNLCAKDLVTDIVKAIAKWDTDHAPWNGDDKAEVTYDWENQLGVEIGSGNSSPSGSGTGTEGDNLFVESTDPVPATADEISDGTIPAASGPDQPGRSLQISREGFSGFE